MQRWRGFVALFLASTFAFSPVWGAGEPALGTVISADRAYLGTSAAFVGTTIYDGDHLSTDQLGNVQLRTGAARLHLSPSSAVVITGSDGNPGAVLSAGTATFSTANSKAFTLRAADATFRAQSDAPTVAQVTLVNAREFLVHTTRGALSVTYAGETQIIPEGNSYRVVLDPEPNAEPAQGPEGVGGFRMRRPRAAGRSHFMIIVITLTTVATVIAVHEVFESAHRP
jgi:hypothetical protein